MPVYIRFEMYLILCYNCLERLESGMYPLVPLEVGAGLEGGRTGGRHTHKRGVSCTYRWELKGQKNVTSAIM